MTLSCLKKYQRSIVLGLLEVRAELKVSQDQEDFDMVESLKLERSILLGRLKQIRLTVN